jgi:hypothetical protein
VCSRKGGPIEHSIVRAGFTVAGVGTVLLNVLIGGVVAVALIQTLFPKVVTCVVVEECSEVFPAMCMSLTLTLLGSGVVCCTLDNHSALHQ